MVTLIYRLNGWIVFSWQFCGRSITVLWMIFYFWSCLAIWSSIWRKRSCGENIFVAIHKKKEVHIRITATSIYYGISDISKNKPFRTAVIRLNPIFLLLHMLVTKFEYSFIIRIYIFISRFIYAFCNEMVCSVKYNFVETLPLRQKMKDYINIENTFKFKNKWIF